MTAPMLVLVYGLPGSGKSALARAFVARYGGTHINSDLVRAALGLRGKYGAADKARVYAAMLAKTRAVLEAGGRAVVDSTFYRAGIREPFERMAGELGVPLFRIAVKAGEETIRQRLGKPRPDSEADFAVYEKIRDQFEPWLAPSLELWSDAHPLDDLVRVLYQYIQTSHDY
ncbi:MAG: AAA family ATPase [Saprospirales bacterium]|nr:AAA family ATPase [Saprospirales bacterium]